MNLYRTVVYRGDIPARYTIPEENFEDAVRTYVEQIERVVITRPFSNMRVLLQKSDGFSATVIQTFELT